MKKLIASAKPGDNRVFINKKKYIYYRVRRAVISTCPSIVHRTAMYLINQIWPKK